VDLARMDDDPFVIYAVNAAGDLFAKTIVPSDDSIDDPELEKELVEKREDSWLATWADSVVGCSQLPRIVLKTNHRLLKENYCNGGVTSRPPVTVKTKQWREKFRGRRKKWKGTESQGQDDQTPSTISEKYFVYNQEGLPHLSHNSDLPADFHAIVTDDTNYKKNKLKLDKLNDFLKEKRQSSLHLPLSTHQKSSYCMVRSDNKFSPILDKKKAAGDSDLSKVYDQFVPHLEKLNLTNYNEGTSYKYSNRHSESILRIMMGEQKAGDVKEGRSDSAQLSSGVPSPAPPSVEDTTFTMEAFWADLGVNAPTPATPAKRRNLSQARSFTSTEYEVEDDW